LINKAGIKRMRCPTYLSAMREERDVLPYVYCYFFTFGGLGRADPKIDIFPQTGKSPPRE
jgi:hypothetical protein